MRNLKHLGAGLLLFFAFPGLASAQGKDWNGNPCSPCSAVCFCGGGGRFQRPPGRAPAGGGTALPSRKPGQPLPCGPGIGQTPCGARSAPPATVALDAFRKKFNISNDADALKKLCGTLKGCAGSLIPDDPRDRLGFYLKLLQGDKLSREDKEKLLLALFQGAKNPSFAYEAYRAFQRLPPPTPAELAKKADDAKKKADDLAASAGKTATEALDSAQVAKEAKSFADAAAKNAKDGRAQADASRQALDKAEADAKTLKAISDKAQAVLGNTLADRNATEDQKKAASTAANNAAGDYGKALKDVQDLRYDWMAKDAAARNVEAAEALAKQGSADADKTAAENAQASKAAEQRSQQAKAAAAKAESAAQQAQKEAAATPESGAQPPVPTPHLTPQAGNTGTPANSGQPVAAAQAPSPAAPAQPGANSPETASTPVPPPSAAAAPGGAAQTAPAASAPAQAEAAPAAEPAQAGFATHASQAPVQTPAQSETFSVEAGGRIDGSQGQPLGGAGIGQTPQTPPAASAAQGARPPQSPSSGSSGKGASGGSGGQQAGGQSGAGSPGPGQPAPPARYVPPPPDLAPPPAVEPPAAGGTPTPPTGEKHCKETRLCDGSTTHNCPKDGRVRIQVVLMDCGPRRVHPLPIRPPIQRPPRDAKEGRSQPTASPEDRQSTP